MSDTRASADPAAFAGCLQKAPRATRLSTPREWALSGPKAAAGWVLRGARPTSVALSTSADAAGLLNRETSAIKGRLSAKLDVFRVSEYFGTDRIDVFELG